MTVGLRSWRAGRSARQKLDDRAAKARSFFLTSNVSDPGFRARDAFRSESASTAAAGTRLRLSTLFPRRRNRERAMDGDATLLTRPLALADARISPRSTECITTNILAL